jgi:hypothetical protein
VAEAERAAGKRPSTVLSFSIRHRWGSLSIQASAAENHRSMDIDRHSKRLWIGFHFTSEDYRRWGKEQLDNFRLEIKHRLPREAWNYNEETLWWSIAREYEYLFDELRARFFRDEHEGNLFE